jgi:hypothetical protein
VVLLCGGGGTGAFVLLQRLQGTGQSTPTAAVEGFLSATTRDLDADRAARYVCPDARKKSDLTRKITELRGYQEKYKGSFEWSRPQIEKSGPDRATLTAVLKFSNTDEQAAQQKLTFLTVNDSGWWVCEITATS